MANNIDPWELLREARKAFSSISEEASERECDCPPEWQRCQLCRIGGIVNSVQRHIDAALKQNEANNDK